MQTIYESFIASTDANPGKALFEQPGGADVSYAEARELVERLAAVLTDLGVQPGDRVAVQTDKSTQTICLYLATLQVGGVYLPLNSAYTGAEIDYFIGDAGPRLFVCTPATLEDHKARESGELRIESLGAAGDGSLMDLAEGATPRKDHVAREMSDHAAILYTSGTTGRSKGAVLTHGNLASNAAALLESWRYTGDDRLIHALPIFHIHGLFVAANMTIAAGATMIWLTKFDAEQIVDLMGDATVLMGVPTFYTRLLKSDRLSRDTASNMRLFVSGSAPLLAEDHRAFEEKTGHPILERYGMTETGMITTNPYDGARKPGAVGMALPGVEVRITDRETGKALPDGKIGAIEVRGPNVFEGYWKMPEKTASEFRDDRFFITGDLGQIGEDGYLRIVGRDKDLVISGGYNVYPKEIEGLIDDLPGVVESAVIGLPHPDLGEGVTAVVVAEPGADLDEKGVIAGIGDQLARFKQPRRVLFVPELPRNVMGKVQKAELRKTYADLYK
ncbi:malonate--CoA ligase [Paracoccus xiamenensis]|uniref:malonate--CoA ligase n=1 Tax=Paracoccus xiamenensis TaxID=2714901 RepID=UPI0014075836|nr:malonyl-CoA synthase [Paracoccus xiamenensis]NHF74417.1 malonyl-CoA synthase [Paracoccus xiamenensis]